MKPMLSMAVGVLLALAACGCASKPRFFQTQSERDETERPAREAQQARWQAENKALETAALKEYLDTHPSLPADIVKGLKDKELVRGMNGDEVFLVLMLLPQQKNISNGEFGTREQWVYPSGTYLYFKNGILDSWQSREINQKK
jgi:hypothetical protein